MRVRRWRLQWWLDPLREDLQGKWYSNDCKLCAAKRARDLARAYAIVKSVPVEHVKWNVLRFNLHHGQEVVVVSCATYPIGLLNDHSHKQPQSGNVGATVHPRGDKRDTESKTVPGGRGTRRQSVMVLPIRTDAGDSGTARQRIREAAKREANS